MIKCFSQRLAGPSSRYETSKLDLIEELLCRNMDHCAEYIFSLLDFEDQLNCLLVSRLWNDFIGGHVFKRRVEYLGRLI